jgi:antitoxin (DNA-binding transcriptional repressor) of toxin-antitoxin stability system
MLRLDRLMKKAGITELKKNLSRYLERVQRGESILVFDWNQPVSRMIPLKKASRSATPDAARLARLERKGLIRRGIGDSSLWVAKRRLLKVEGSVLQNLLDERRSSR